MRVATRAAAGGTSGSTALACRRRPLGGRLSLGRKNELCASGAAASLALQVSQGGHVVTESAVSCWVYLELSSIHADGGEAP